MKTCSPLKNTTKATVHFSSTNCGDTARYQCKTPHEVLLGPGVRKCNESQNWTGHEPQCIGMKRILKSYTSFKLKFKYNKQAFNLISKMILILIGILKDSSAN